MFFNNLREIDKDKKHLTQDNVHLCKIMSLNVKNSFKAKNA